MRTVLVGSDFMYDINNNLKVIEINTSVGNNTNSVEVSINDKYDTTDLINFIGLKGFNSIVYVGNNEEFDTIFSQVCTTLSLTYNYMKTTARSITIPYVEDNDETLIIRSAYDTTALVDDTYCADKVNFLNLIKDSEFGCQFAYKDSNGSLINYITDIKDNGIHPNFVLKAKHPNYDKDVYPKLYRVTNQTELDIILENITFDYFLMEYYYNDSNLHDNRLSKIRSINLLYPPLLESISLGQYTDLTTRFLTNSATYDNTTYEILNEYRNEYITDDRELFKPKLSDTDKVELSDGSFKTALEIEVGDELKTIIIPNAGNIDTSSESANYEISLEEFISGATYSTNQVTFKTKVDRGYEMINITFTDNSTWKDTAKSSYLVVRNNETRFELLQNLIPGDTIVLIDTSNPTQVQTSAKIIQTITTEYETFSGWVIGVAETHIYLVKSDDNTQMLSFAAIEHNGCFYPGQCPKYAYCDYFGRCLEK